MLTKRTCNLVLASLLASNGAMAEDRVIRVALATVQSQADAGGRSGQATRSLDYQTSEVLRFLNYPAEHARQKGLQEIPAALSNSWHDTP